MKTSKKSLALAVILSLGVCANAWAETATTAVQVGAGVVGTTSKIEASGEYSVAIGVTDGWGTTTTASGVGSVAIGRSAMATADAATALGTYAFAFDQATTAFGTGTTVYGYLSSAFGAGAQTQKGYAAQTALGDHSTVIGNNSVAVGSNAIVGNKYFDHEDQIWYYDAATSGSAFGDYSQVRGDYGTALGAYAYASGKNSIALGSNSHAFEDNIVSVGGEWEDYDSGTKYNIKRRITNVAAAKDPTDALTFNNFKYDTNNVITAMEFITNDGVKTYTFGGGSTITLDKTLDPNSTNGVENQAVAKADIATNDKIGDINSYSSTNYIAQGDSTVTSISKLDAALGDTNNKVGDINNYSSTNYISQGDSTVTSIGKLDAQVKTNTDSITKETSERIAADKDLQDQIDNLGNNMAGNVERLDSDVKSVGAMAAAMAGLHPRFTGDGKGEFAAAIGSYDGKKATAIGAFYAPDERFMFSLGGAFAAGGKKMANLGVNIALDPKPHVNKKFYEQEITELKASNQAQAEQLNAQAQQLNDQAAQIKALMQRLSALENK